MDIENMTEEELAAVRGDNLPEEPKTEEPAPVEEAKETEETEGETPVEETTEAETEETEEAEAQEEEPQRPLMMPKSRYDSVMARLREQERINQELQARLQQAPQQAPQQTPQPDVQQTLDEIDAKLAEAIKEGDADTAAKLMRESRVIQQQQLQQALQGTRQSASEATIQQIQYDNFLTRAEQAIPAINPDSDSFDEGLVTEIVELADAFERQGKSPVVALERALDYIKPEGWGAPAPAPTPAPAPRKTDVKRNVDAAKAQPPRMETGGNSDAAGVSNKLDIMKLSDAEFEKLTEDELAKLRGDFA